LRSDSATFDIPFYGKPLYPYASSRQENPVHLLSKLM
jgi:hypothetical protein